MTDALQLTPLGQFTPEGQLTPGYGDHYLFFVGRDDCHGILHYLIPQERLTFRFNMFGYDDDELNADIVALMHNPNVRVQGTLDKSQASGVHERQILAHDRANDPDFYNSIAVGQSATHQISHTKGGVLDGLGLYFEGSMNWSASGEGTGIDLHADPAHPTPGWKAQNNTFLVSANPVGMRRFAARLDTEHLTAITQQHARAASASKETAA